MESEVNIEAPPINQLNNPYTEATILSRHTDIVRLLLQLDIHRCISAGEDGLVIIWDIKTGLVVHVLQGHSRPISCMLVLDRPGEKMLLTAASDRQICVWNTDTGQVVQTITEHDSSVKCLVQLPGAEVFCSGGEKLILWNSQGRLLHSITRHDQKADIHLMITIKNDRIITASDKDIVAYGIVSCGNVDTQHKEIRLVKNVPHNREPIRSLINISESCFASGSLDGAIILWSTQTLTPSRIFNSVKDYMGESKLYPYSVQYLVAYDERYLFGAIGCGFCGYDITTGTMIVDKQNAHYSKVLCLGFVMDGLFLATCSEDCSIRLWGLTPDSDITKHTELKDRHIDSTDTMKTADIMKNFIGISGDQLKLYKGPPFNPPLMGELLGHSGAVQMFVDYGKSGLFSCGVDGLIIAWKNAELQSLERDKIIRDQHVDCFQYLQQSSMI